MFHYHIVHEQDRQDVFGHLRNNSDFTVHHLDLFEEVIVLNRSLLRKFGPIKDKQIYIKTLTEIKSLLHVRQIATVEVNGTELKFHGARDFINFFNDNHLTSHFTKRFYTSHSKTEEK